MLMNAIISFSYAALILGLFILAAWLRVRHKRHEAERLRKKVEKAKDDILADGIIEGPKGPYVAHKPWRKGSGTVTPKQTGNRSKPGYHGTPWPK